MFLGSIWDSLRVGDVFIVPSNNGYIKINEYNFISTTDLSRLYRIQFNGYLEIIDYTTSNEYWNDNLKKVLNDT